MNSKSVSIARTAVALTIAGSDPSGGAGLQADLKSFQQLGVYGMSVVTLITVQNTQAVRRVEVLAPDLILAQLDAVLDDIPPRAIKVGALGSAEVVRAVSGRLRDVKCPIVVDPVLVSKHGHTLVTDDVIDAYKQHLFPLALLVTPNRFEAERLTGMQLNTQAAIRNAIQTLGQFGMQHVLVKIGEVNGQSRHILSLNDAEIALDCPRLAANNTHGAGCILAAAVTAKLALGETRIQAAVQFGIQRTLETIECNTHLGRGVHPAEIRAMARESLA